ncbi:MAG TPA: hypothetical protein GX511_02855 [Firmicutes bacterium]|nr:hypothetical protein [Bacillota bacterium]
MRKQESFLGSMSPEERVKFLRGFFTSGGTPPAAEQSARADLLAALLEEREPDPRTLRAWQDHVFAQEQVKRMDQVEHPDKS